MNKNLTFLCTLSILTLLVCALSIPADLKAEVLAQGYTCTETTIYNKKNKVITLADAKKDIQKKIQQANLLTNTKKKKAKKAALKALKALLIKCSEGGFIVQSAAVDIESEQCTSKKYDVTVTFLPARSGRPVSLEISADNGQSWSALAAGSDSGNGSAALSYTAPDTAGTYLFRAHAEAFSGLVAGSSGPIEATVSPCGSDVINEPLPIIRAGGVHTCILDGVGEAWCWGENKTGSIGDGTFTNRTKAVKVSGGHVFKTIELGYEHTCALTEDGTAYCWGHGENQGSGSNFPAKGALGNGTAANSNVPVQVSGGLKFKRISLGVGFTCGITVNGLTYCWGYNYEGQLGNGDVFNEGGHEKLLPTQVTGSANYTEIECGNYHVCALTSSGQVDCWGDTSNYAYPYVDPTQNAPKKQKATGYLHLALGSSERCGILSSGTIQCWGGFESAGSFGNGPGDSAGDTPLDVLGGTYVAFSMANHGGCALKADQDAYCWGYNLYGAVGDGTGGNVSFNRGTPTKVIGNIKWRHVRSGYGHSCGMSVGNTPYCWGGNIQGQVGNGASGFTNFVFQPSPVQFSQ